MGDLTKGQRKRLVAIRDYFPIGGFPHPSFHRRSRTEQSLLAGGLVEVVQHQTRRAGNGATILLVRLTSAGRATLAFKGTLPPPIPGEPK